MADGSAACPACGKAAGGGGAAAPASGNENIIGLLCYAGPVGLIGIIISLVVEPFSKNKFNRFHAFQAIFMFVAFVCLWFAMIFLGIILAFLGPMAMIMLLVYPLIGLGAFVLAIVMMIHAYQNKMTRLPIIGNIAARMAGV
ncbi:MAG: hypothetical protein HYX26_01090 [Acidobacteriales bacterium]|nr:hypothetical protein [Terriglobales bacterium]